MSNNSGVQFMMQILEFVAGVFVVLGAIALAALLLAGLTALVFDLPTYISDRRSGRKDELVNPTNNPTDNIWGEIVYITKSHACIQVHYDEHSERDYPKMVDALVALFHQEATKARINEIEALQKDIVGVDKYRSDVDQQAWAYARVHRLAGDRIATLKATLDRKGDEDVSE